MHKAIGGGSSNIGAGSGDIDPSGGDAEASLSGGLDGLREDNSRLWKMIKDAQNASNDAGLIGMVGSPAWIGQIKKALSHAETRRIECECH